MGYHGTEYTIHFDDTMAYGSHHFLTGFKFQCASRESFLFGDSVFDMPGVRDALDGVYLLTADAYSRNLSPARIGDRLAILLTLEEWGKASARFCYRVISESGKPVAAGFQTLLCADATTGEPTLIPESLRVAMDQMRQIEEPLAAESFRDRALAGGSKTESLFDTAALRAAAEFLRDRYPRPQVIDAHLVGQDQRELDGADAGGTLAASVPPAVASEAWVFSGQGSFDPALLSARIVASLEADGATRGELAACIEVVRETLQLDLEPVVSGAAERCSEAVKNAPGLSQIAIFLQSVLGARVQLSQGLRPTVLLGHSFGEIAALGVAGCFDLPTGVRVVCARVRSVEEHAPPGGGLLAVSADRASITTECSLLGLDQLVIAGRNHDRQTIVSGPLEQLQRLSDHCRRRDTSATLVPTPTSFHHPRLRDAAAAWLGELRGMPIQGPSLPVYSPISRRFVARDEDIAATLASQLLLPFDLKGSVGDLINVGVTRFVDCGSTGALANLLSRACPEGFDVRRAESPTGHTAPGEAAAHAVAKPAREESAPERPLIERESLPPSAPNALGAAPIVIVGQGCLLPGGARDPEALYSAIMERRSGLVDQRDFDPDWSDDFYSAKLVADRSTSHLTGRVNDDDIAVPPGVDARMFESFSRTQKLLCVSLAPCIAGLRDADRVTCLIGATADGFEDQDVVSALRYAGIDPASPTVDERLKTAAAAFREPHDTVQEVFDRMIHPGIRVVLVDAACASSLYAIALGMRSLEAGETDAVIAGGVFCPGPGNSCLFSQFNGTTSTGCRPFDANADGVVFSEGSALVTLRRLGDAERLGLPIVAVLSGEGLSSDGRSSSANVPQTHGQILALERCYESYGLDPASIDAIEAHGTSTRVGDGTEVETLRRYFAEHVSEAVPIHSLKGLLGHAGWAAGAASVIAACQYLRAGVFPSQAHFHEPATAVTNASGTLRVPVQPERLPGNKCRLAIDGFGFGGANAHVVLERYLGGTAHGDRPFSQAEDHDEIVFVAIADIAPTVTAGGAKRFDRAAITPPDDCIVLPDLAEDLDISQVLTMNLVNKLRSDLPGLPADASRETAIVLALSGKTERGVEATMRVLSARLRRGLSDLQPELASLAGAVENSRRSGAYTLQAMMPNVSAGRASLHYNLNGPNFVIDAGADSLQASLDAATLLLRGGADGGSRMVMVAAIDANPWRMPLGEGEHTADEFAAAFAVTTRSYAERRQLPILATAGDLPSTAESGAIDVSAATQVRRLLGAISRAGENSGPIQLAAQPVQVATDAEYPLYESVWVEARPRVLSSPDACSASERRAALAITTGDEAAVAELVAQLQRRTERYLVVVVGEGAHAVADHSNSQQVLAVDAAGGAQAAGALDLIDAFAPDWLLGVEAIDSWDLRMSLGRVANSNHLAELLFLVAQRRQSSIEAGALRVDALFLDGWRDAPHPVSGPAAGLLKAIQRELPTPDIKVACTRGRTLGEALEELQQERLGGDRDLEVVYDGAVRKVRRFRQTPSALVKKPPVALTTESVVVATGGARGVTAVMVESLLEDFGCKVVAIGRSELEPAPGNLSDPDLESAFYDRYVNENPHASGVEMKRAYESAYARWEAYETIRSLGAKGRSVEYIAADITNRDEATRVVREIANKHGRIDLLVHGAGVQTSKRLEHRTLDDFRRTYSVKVAGLQNLIDAGFECVGQVVPAHLLTSAYSVFGNDGQHDYGAANETLDRLCGLAPIESGVPWSSMGWLAWDGVGMTRGSEYQRLAAERGLSGVTIEAGQAIFRRVTSGECVGKSFFPMAATEHLRYALKTVPPTVQGARGRLFEVALDLAGIPCLPHHLVRGVPTLPGAWILDRMVYAALKLRGDVSGLTAAVATDVAFHRFVKVLPNQDAHYRVIVEEAGDGAYAWLLGDCVHSSGDVLARDVLFAEARIEWQSETEPLAPPTPGIGPLNGVDSVPVENDPYCAPHGGAVALTGPFDCVREISMGPLGRRAVYSSLPGHFKAGVIPTYLLDSAWRVGAMHANPGRDELYVPVRMGRLVLPLFTEARTTSRPDWEIRTSAPRLEDGQVRWDRTEAFSDGGGSGLVVEDSLAAKLD